MTMLGLISGKLWRAPEAKTAKTTGKPFSVATIREGSGDAVTWWSVVAFEQNAAELLELRDGDAISVSGPFSVETYVKGEQTRLRFRIVADRLAAPRLSTRKGAT